MTPADLFMRYLFIVGPVIVVIALVLRRIARAYPDTAFRGFESPGQLGSCYRFARGTLREHRWLFWLPLALHLSIYAYRIPMWASVRRGFMEFLNAHHMGSMRHALPQGLAFREVGELLIRMPARLNPANPGFMVSSIIVIVVFLVAVGVPRKLIGELKYYAGAGDAELGFLRSALSAGRIVLLSGVVLLVLASLLQVQGLATALAIVLGLALTVGALLIAGLIEGFILFYLKDIVEGRAPARDTALRRALDILPALFAVNLIVAFTAQLHVMIAYPKNITYLLGDWLSGAHFGIPTVGFALTIKYMEYAGSAISIFIILAGLPLVLRKTSPWEALRNNFRLVGKYFLRYLALVGSGVLLLFIPLLLKLLLSRVIHPMSYPGLLVAILISALSVWLGALFFIASFRFFMDHSDAVRAGR